MDDATQLGHMLSLHTGKPGPGVIPQYLQDN